MNSYRPDDLETKWYKYWESNGFFSPDHPWQKERKRVFTIVIPPPNVTGSLHVGHALVNTLQDVIIRWKRMSGFKTLWLPGTDHAGIATQMVVERNLKAKGIDRETIGREKFEAEVWKWKEQYGNTIFRQLRKLGASCDWSRERFTLDAMLSKAVKKTFVDFHREGLIYRDNYMVNWCPRCKTALSNLEVDHEDRKGKLSYLAYPLEEGHGELIVATTRPETMLGDTGVAVNPNDERYRSFIGRYAVLPLLGRRIPVIADDFVDMQFGTGAVKVTPAHDPNDFKMGRRYDLPEVNIFTRDAKINEIFPALQGLDRFEARKRILEMLKEEGAVRKVEEHNHVVGQCQRCKTVVEPRVSLQWFCRMDEMAEAAKQAVERGELTFFPKNQKKLFLDWLGRIENWCISRQLWWGHRIPAWYCGECGEIVVSEREEVERCPKCASPNPVRETDVLDTWFSSGLFPFSTMGWPDKTSDFETYYPNSALLTGYDILFFWVARMVMMGIKTTGRVPFPQVFLNGLVRDEHGRKMSKSLGNVIDPLNAIKEYGADTLRFTLTALTVMGNDCNLTDSVLKGYRNFINKLWNATRFTLFHIERLGEPEPIATVKPEIFDRWIVNRLKRAACDINRHLEAYRFNEAAKSIYSFVWHEFCDWYIEIVKPALFQKLGKGAQKAALSTVVHVLEQSLRLLHPIAPFVTEELWQKLRNSMDLNRFSPGGSSQERETLMLADFPRFEPSEIEEMPEAEELIELIKAIRNIRGENDIKPNVKIGMTVVCKSDRLSANIVSLKETLYPLAGIETIFLADEYKKRESDAGSVGKEFEVFVHLAETVDAQQEIDRFEKERKKLEAKRKRIEGKLDNQNFMEKAPRAVIEKNREELDAINRKMEKIEKNLASLKNGNPGLSPQTSEGS